MNSFDPISSRTMSAYPVSIGTSLALESLAVGPQPAYDPLRPVPKRIHLSKYQEFWINAHTLFRNLIGAMDKGALQSIMPGDAALAMEAEVDIIRQLVKDESKGQAQLVIYASQYQGLEKAHPGAKLRKAKTELQLLNEVTTQNAINGLFMRLTKDEGFVFDRALQPKRPVKALIMTHYAYDLLSYRNFSDLHLLESHTGALKQRPLWYTKLSDGKELIRVPYGPWSMQLFGDSMTFTSLPLAWRKEWLMLSEKFKTTQSTTLDRLIFMVTQIKDADFKAWLGKAVMEFKNF